MAEWIITSSLLIIVVVLLRTALKGKISLRLQYTLWAVVLLRLLVPVSLSDSSLSVMNITAILPERAAVDIRHVVSSPLIPMGTVDYFENSEEYKNTYAKDYDIDISEVPEPDDSTMERYARQRSSLSLAVIAKWIWLCGVLAVGLCLIMANTIFYVRLKRTRIRYDNLSGKLPVYVSAKLPTPCMFGIFPLAIYLTPNLIDDEKKRNHVLAHELTHYAHKDNLWAALRGVCLALHWYNPLVWLAAFLSRRDAELACDEGTIERLGEKQRIEYGRTLVGLMTVRRNPVDLLYAAMSMTSGKVGIKERIIMIAKKPKMLFPVLLAVVLIIAVAVVCTFTGGKADLDAKIEAGLNDSDPLARQAWTMIKQDIEQNEYVSSEVFIYQGTIFTDAEITKLELTDSFDDISKDAVIEVYELNYRMLPKDPKKIVLAGGMQIEDGWLLEKSSMGSPYLVAKNIGGERTYIGTIYPDGEGKGVLDTTLELLYRLEAENSAAVARSPIEISRIFAVTKPMLPKEAAELLTLCFVESLCESEDLENPRFKTFVFTEYKDLSFEIYPSTDAPEEYALQKWEISDNTWVIEPSVSYRFDGTISPIGNGGSIPSDQWITGLYQGSRIGFLMTKKGDTYTFRSRLYTQSESSEISTVGGADGPVGIASSLPLDSYIKTASRMNYRHTGWQSYTMDEDSIGFVADAITDALPETLDQMAAQIDNESIARDYWEQGSCVELVFDVDAELTYTLLGDIKRSYSCDRMLVCLTKSEDVLFLSKDGVYTHTVGPLDVAALKPVYDWLHSMEFVGYMGPDRAEILGQKITVHRNADLDQLPAGYDMRPLESAMSRSLAFYQAAHFRWYELIDRLATDGLRAEIQKWNHNNPSEASDLMQLRHITGVAFPVSVSKPVFLAGASGRLGVTLGLDENTTVEIELAEGSDGRFLIDSFKVAATGRFENWELNTLGNLGFGYSAEDFEALSQDQIKSIFAPGATPDGAPAFMPDDAQRAELSANGITEAQSGVLGNLGYSYEEMLELPPEEFNFIFPNTELWEKLAAKGYDTKALRRPDALQHAGYESFKALIREALSR